MMDNIIFEECDLREKVERAHRITRLIEERGMTPAAAATVVDAAMFGIGCLEGTIRARIEREKRGVDRPL
jgi:hypothetical protein